MTDLTGKIAVVTGGASGIGKATALAFVARGASVMIADLDEGGSQALVAEIAGRGGTAASLRTDVSNEEEVAALTRETLRRFGRLDYAVNSAGIEGDVGFLADQTARNFERVLAVNLFGVFVCMKYQIPAMLQHGGGAIVNISSIGGVRGHPAVAPYIAAKHGVNGLTKTAAVEYGSRGIRVNALCPGAVRTPTLESYLAAAAPEMRQAVSEANPLKRLGEPEEMAEIALWLCSPASSYVNGHELVADGGKIVSDV